MNDSDLAKKLESFFGGSKRLRASGPMVLVEKANSVELQLPLIYLAHAVQRVHGGTLVGFWARESHKNWRAKLLVMLGRTFFGRKTSSERIYSCAGIKVKLRPGRAALKSRFASNVRDELRKAALSKDSLERFTWAGAHIGDLIYDEWLKRSDSSTVELGDPDFLVFLDEVARTVSFWVDLFESREISAVISSGPYLQGVPLRFATANMIPAYAPSSPSAQETRSFSISLPRPYLEGLSYRTDFFSLSGREQALGKESARQSLHARIDLGNRDEYLHSDIQWQGDVSEQDANPRDAFGFTKSLPLVFVSPHHFNDSPHVYMGLYPDYESWLWAVGRNANPDRANWIIKGHPDDTSELSAQVLGRFIRDFPFFRLVPNTTSNKSLLRAGVSHVLTIYGSIGLEMAYLGKTVVNASPINPHSSFEFNINPKSREEFEETVRALPTVYAQIDLEEVFACYYMHYLRDRGSFFRPSNKIADAVGEWYTDRCSSKDHERILASLERWVRSGEYRLLWSKFGLETTLNSDLGSTQRP